MFQVLAPSGTEHQEAAAYNWVLWKSRPGWGAIFSNFPKEPCRAERADSGAQKRPASCNSSRSFDTFPSVSSAGAAWCGGEQERAAAARPYPRQGARADGASRPDPARRPPSVDGPSGARDRAACRPCILFKFSQCPRAVTSFKDTAPCLRPAPVPRRRCTSHRVCG